MFSLLPMLLNEHSISVMAVKIFSFLTFISNTTIVYSLFNDNEYSVPGIYFMVNLYWGWACQSGQTVRWIHKMFYALVADLFLSSWSPCREWGPPAKIRSCYYTTACGWELRFLSAGIFSHTGSFSNHHALPAARLQQQWEREWLFY